MMTKIMMIFCYLRDIVKRYNSLATITNNREASAKLIHGESLTIVNSVFAFEVNQI